mgnify:FL=1
MKLLLLTWCVVGCTGSLALAGDHPALKSIFNGKDFSGWKVPEEARACWIAENGILKVRSSPEKKGSTLWTTTEFKDFVMTFEFKMGEGTIDSGIFMRNDHDQIQIGISGSLKRDMTASPYIPGKGYPVEAKGVKELLKTDDWNSMKIEATGKTYISWLNGKKVMTYTSESAVEKGPVGIQLHGNRDMAIDYRNIKIASVE